TPGGCAACASPVSGCLSSGACFSTVVLLADGRSCPTGPAQCRLRRIMRVADEGVAVGIPSGLSGVLAFIVLLWPGFAYNSVRSRRRPARQLTTLQETAVI